MSSSLEIKKEEVFTKNLVSKKEELGYTTEQIALKLKVKKSKVGAWLEGRAMPRLKDWPEVCRVFKIEDPLKFITEKIA